jgi:hypothetical protein
VAQRILRGATATLTYENLDSLGQRTPADGTVTVGVTRADGTTLIAPGTATTSVGGGLYSVSLTAAQTSTLDLLTATWSDSAAPGVTRTSEHEVVGGFMFTIDDVMGEQGVSDYDKLAIADRRAEVEDECEWICDVAWVPRYRRLVLDGTDEDTILTGIRQIRTVRSARIYSTTGGSTYTSLSAGQLAGLVASPDGMLRRSDRDYWPLGFGNVVLEVEHGYNAPPADLRTAAVVRCQDLLFRPDSAIPTRARSYTDGSGFSYDLNTPDKFSTGIATVDAVYRRRSLRESMTPEGTDGGGSSSPVSRTLSLDPQYWGLYRGGRT